MLEKEPQESLCSTSRQQTFRIISSLWCAPQPHRTFPSTKQQLSAQGLARQ